MDPPPSPPRPCLTLPSPSTCLHLPSRPNRPSPFAPLSRSRAHTPASAPSYPSEIYFRAASIDFFINNRPPDRPVAGKSLNLAGPIPYLCLVNSIEPARAWIHEDLLGEKCVREFWQPWLSQIFVTRGRISMSRRGEKVHEYPFWSADDRSSE